MISYLGSVIITIIIAALIIYGFIKYIKWASQYKQDALVNPQLKESFYYQLIPPQALIDSLKYLQFWVEYYSMYILAK